jgi:hypothetical protein
MTKRTAKRKGRDGEYWKMANDRQRGKMLERGEAGAG